MYKSTALFAGALLLALGLLPANAQEFDKTAIPEKIRADILKRHPKATDLHASYETHFKRNLLEVTFKEEGSDEPVLELFREDGHLFTNEMLLEGLGEAPADVKAVLDKNFSKYTIKKAEMIGNPNGTGEEYEVYLVSGGVNWKISINDKGEIQSKDHF